MQIISSAFQDGEATPRQYSRSTLELEPGADRDALEDAKEGRVLDQPRLTETYERE